MAMPGTKKTVLSLFALSCAAYFGAPYAQGCAFHNVLPDSQFESMYAGSISVAVALRSAAQDGVIDVAALEGAATGTLSYSGAMQGLYGFGAALAASSAAADLPPRFSLGYVESRLWTRYSHSDGKVGVEIHIDGPAEGEPVMLTGEVVLTALRDGTLSIDDALAEGLVVIVANEADTSAIRQALAQVTGRHRISLN